MLRVQDLCLENLEVDLRGLSLFFRRRFWWHLSFSLPPTTSPWWWWKWPLAKRGLKWKLPVCEVDCLILSGCVVGVSGGFDEFSLVISEGRHRIELIDEIKTLSPCFNIWLSSNDRRIDFHAIAICEDCDFCFSWEQSLLSGIACSGFSEVLASPMEV